MRVMTWNIWDVPGGRAREARLPLIVKALTALAADPDGPDIVLLQEVWSARRRPRFRAIFPHVAEAETYWRNPLNWIAGPVERLRDRYLTVDSGLMTLSRHKVAEIRRHRYRTGERLARKSALAALVETPDLGRVWAVNTHLCAAYPHTTNSPNRRAQLAELGGFLKTLTGHPVVIGGDFNVAPPSVGPLPAWSHDPALWPQAMAEALPGFTEAPEAAGHLTCTASFNPWSDMREGDNRLDYIWAGPGLTVSGGRVAMDERHPLGRDRTLPLSDHFGYAADIAVGQAVIA